MGFSVDPMRRRALPATAEGRVDSRKEFKIDADKSPKIIVPLRPVRPTYSSQATRLPVSQRNGNIQKHSASPVDPFLLDLQLGARASI
jgi:hypothetical protein